MKIFISWSGEQSLAAALRLREWLQLIFEEIEPFVSAKDIRKGKQWNNVIPQQLKDTDFGIVCLTPSNTTQPWIQYESGALSKKSEKAYVGTLLLGGLKNADIDADNPLAAFQHTEFNKDQFFQLVETINSAVQHKQPDNILKKKFEAFWPELEKDVQSAIGKESTGPKKREPEVVLEEILDLTRQLAKGTSKSTETENELRELRKFAAYRDAENAQRSAEISYLKDALAKAEAKLAGLAQGQIVAAAIEARIPKKAVPIDSLDLRPATKDLLQKRFAFLNELAKAQAVELPLIPPDDVAKIYLACAEYGLKAPRLTFPL